MGNKCIILMEPLPFSIKTINTLIITLVITLIICFSAFINEKKKVMKLKNEIINLKQITVKESI